jgi:hypothetical protein
MVIVGAAFISRENDLSGAAIKILSGVIIDAVAALFFVQSRRAQQAMGAFFEKLRTDRQLIEARKMCEEICDTTTKDKIKTILILHYSGLESRPLVNILAGDKAHHTKDERRNNAHSNSELPKDSVNKHITPPAGP